MTSKNAEQRVLNGSVWDDFCDAPKAAGKVVQSEKAPTDAFTKAEGLSWKTGEKTRTETDLMAWEGKRAQAGRLPPKGFSRSNKFS